MPLVTVFTDVEALVAKKQEALVKSKSELGCDGECLRAVDFAGLQNGS